MTGNIPPESWEPAVVVRFGGRAASDGRTMMMNQPPPWEPQGPWSAQPYAAAQGGAPPPRDRTRTILIVAACVVGVASMSAIFMGTVRDRRVKKQTAGARCHLTIGKFAAFNEDIPSGEAAEGFRRLRNEVERGIADCQTAGMPSAVAGLENVRGQLDRKEATADEEARAARRPSRRDQGSTTLDPASCPKGRRLFDTDTGRSIACTGGAAGTKAGSDDYGDLQARCNSVNAAWDRSDGIEPIITCSGGGPNHQDIEVEVSGAAWTFLGERGKRHAFAKSLVDAYRPHWKTFHGWSGADPAEKQVHIMKVSGADTTLAALTSAGGLYVE